MKKNFSFFIKIFWGLSLFCTTSLFALELTRDTFSGNANGWTGTGVTYNTSGGGRLRINSQDTASKTFSYPAYANKPVIVTLTATKISTWESSDVFRVLFNGTQVYNNNATGNITLQGTFNASGLLTIALTPNSNAAAEDIYIDNVIITVPSFSIANATIVEGNSGTSSLNFTVTLSNSVNASVNYATSNGTATAGSDYTATSGTLNFTSTGVATQTISVPILGDTITEPNEAFTITLSSPVGAIIETASATGTIFDDDTLVTVGEREFALRNPITTRNIKGGLKVIGNTVLCVQSNGACYNYTGNSSNSELDLRYIDVDSVNRTYNNSSQAQLDIPTTATVKWAGIYTQGYINNNNATSVSNIVQEAVYVTIPSLGTLAIIPEIIDLYANSTDGYTYDTYATIPTLAGKKGAEVNGWITGANIKADTGTENSGLGNFGAWTLVVVYEDSSETLKNISVFDGYKRVANQTGFQTVDITISGFLTPTSGDVKSTLSIFAGEGDRNIAGDKLYVDGIAINETNAFYSTISGFNANPSYTNNQGIDIQNHKIGKDGDTTHPQIIGNEKQSATIRLTSTQDTYFPSVVAFTTELYEPRVCYNETYYNADGNQTITTPTMGDIITVKSWIANMKIDASDANLETAQKVEITIEHDSTNLEYQPETTTIKNIGDSAYLPKTDAQDSDIATFYSDTNTSVWRVGIGANATNGGDLEPNMTGDDDNKVYIAYKTKILSSGNIQISNLYKVSYENSNMGLRIGDESPLNIGICRSDFNSTISVSPPIGVFTVTNSNFSGSSISTDSKHADNALYTQVADQAFSVKVLALNNDFTSLKSYTGDVNLTLITTPSYLPSDSDVQKQAKCDAATALGTRQAISFNNQSSKDVTLNYSSAYKDVAFKITYDANGIIKHVCSRDSFSIRPANYTITTNTSPLIGARTYNLILNSINSAGTTTPGYTQTVTNNANQSAFMTLSPPSTCTLPATQTLLNTLSFSNGSASYTPFIYPNIGDVNVTVSDNEWTRIDQNSYTTKGFDDCIVGSNSNTPSNGKVGCLIKKIQPFVFIPKQFTNTLNVQNFDNRTFTYISNDGNMSAEVLLTTTATLDDNTTATNYTANCFAKDISYTLTLLNNPLTWLNGTPDAISRIRYFEDGVSSNFENNATVGSATFSSPQSSFTNGTANNLTMLFNFTRTTNRPDEPFEISKNDFNISVQDTNGTLGVDFDRTLNESSTFYYGRIHAPDTKVSGNIANDIRLYYEVYCRTCNRTALDINGSESVDSIYWYNNILHTPTHAQLANGDFTSTSGTTISDAQPLSIDLTAPSLPHKDKILIHAPLWLIQNPILPTATTNNFLIEFTKGATTWAGQGKLGRTIDDTNTSVSKKTNKRIEW